MEWFQTLWGSFLVNFLSNLVSAGFIWLMVNGIDRLSSYKVIVVKKKRWAAFEKVAPKIVKQILDP